MSDNKTDPAIDGRTTTLIDLINQINSGSIKVIFFLPTCKILMEDLADSDDPLESLLDADRLRKELDDKALIKTCLSCLIGQVDQIKETLNCGHGF